jgi:uncharacterized protein (DUF983 family)
MSKLYRVFNKIDTVEGFCEECGEQTILVAIVSEFYRCTNCGHDTKQHIMVESDIYNSMNPIRNGSKII